MTTLEQFRKTFFEECDELLGQLEIHLSEGRGGAADTECLNAIFRAVHSIKAGAGAFNLKQLVEFSHVFETALDGLRSQRIAATVDNFDLFIRAADVLAEIVAAAARDDSLPPDFGRDILADIRLLTENAAEKHLDSPPAKADASEDSGNTKNWRISFRPHAELFQHANEPLLIIRELKTLGALTVTADYSRLPALEQVDPEDAYLAWDLLLVSDCSRTAIEEVFEFVVEDCALEIINAPEASDPTTAEFEQLPGARQLGAEATNDTRSGDVVRRSAVSSIRVDLDRIDRLVNMVGELVITQSMLSQTTSDLPPDRHATLLRGLETLALHTREIQESVMAIRMQPVKSVFARMPRLVRDLSRELNKKVHLVTNGENTEVDKTVIEEISDPITHMIRNALDHGLEPSAERRSSGKPEEGTIRLSAEHRGGRIVIEVADDGRGINRERVLARARERGIVAPGAKLNDAEIDNLIFAPGFSTAETVTDVSGRGVGMDVVRRNVQSLGGRVNIQSTPGQGSCFTMTLPLTLAVLDGMIVSVGEEKFILPITNIVESIRPRPNQIHRLATGEEVVSIRGSQVRLVYTSHVLDVPGAKSDPAEGLVVLVDAEENGRIGLVVDELLGQQQVVIKSLEENYDPIPGISAATILGNGKVALILDVGGLARMRGASTMRKADESSRVIPTDLHARSVDLGHDTKPSELQLNGIEFIST